MFNEMTVVEAEQRRQAVRFIDVRSPGEFAQGSIPGAINVPLLDDEERARVGTTYKQVGRAEATRLAMDLVSPKIPHFVRCIDCELSGGQAPLIFCWRGGKRSEAMATFVDLAGTPVYRLTGGYRAYRNYVVERLASAQLKMPLIVLNGLTGVGKTDVLARLAARGEAVIDLEQLAGHRGSAFGSLGEIEPRNQKQFDALLWETIKQINDRPYVFIEGESKRIGRVLVPDFLMDAKLHGVQVYLEAPLSVRVARIVATYHPQGTNEAAFQQDVREAISRIEKRLAPDVRQTLHEAVTAADYEAVVQLLLTNYYDPRYAHTFKQYDTMYRRIDSTDLEAATTACHEAAREITATQSAHGT